MLLRGPEPLKFGSGRVVSQVIAHPNYENLTPTEQAERLGRAVGCPVVQKLLRPETGRGGPEGMRDRYLEVGLWFGHMVHATEEVNPDLARQLLTSVVRRKGELMGDHESESVPVNYDRIIPPTETLVGYSLPRLLIEMHDHSASRYPRLSPADHLIHMWGVVQDAAAQADNPSKLMALCAKSAAEQGMESTDILQTILPTGWVVEHNGHYMVNQFKNMLCEDVPELWATYIGMDKGTQSALKIIP